MFLRRFVLAITISALAFSFSSTCVADEGHPVALRHWPGGGFTVETMWGFHIGVGLSDAVKATLDRPVDAELEHLPGLAGDACFLERKPNQDEVIFHEHTPPEAMLNAVQMSISKAYETKEHRDARPLSTFTTVIADDVTFMFLDHDRVEFSERMRKLKLSIDERGESQKFENTVVVVATGEEFSAEFCSQYAAHYNPKIMLVGSSIKVVGDQEVEQVSHNTLSVSAQQDKPSATRFVSLGTAPYEMSDTVKELFAKKEAACAASREMFAKLSVEQMNFIPANGSHTPRWNAEHMMGRELGFFSEIYHAVDPSVPVMNLNPKQMPKDYQFAHEDWTGAEEARQMKRVEDFTRRFAYMLDGMDLDKKAKGSRFWTPRKLLMQMERHYNEHSANVVKKMKLDGWPKE